MIALHLQTACVLHRAPMILAIGLVIACGCATEDPFEASSIVSVVVRPQDEPSGAAYREYTRRDTPAIVRMTAVATVSDGRTRTVTADVVWTSSDTTVATVNPDGVVTVNRRPAYFYSGDRPPPAAEITGQYRGVAGGYEIVVPDIKRPVPVLLEPASLIVCNHEPPCSAPSELVLAARVMSPIEYPDPWERVTFGATRWVQTSFGFTLDSLLLGDGAVTITDDPITGIRTYEYDFTWIPTNATPGDYVVGATGISRTHVPGSAENPLTIMITSQ